MAFNGHSFTFDNRSCRDFGLIIYDFGSNAQNDSQFVTRDAFEDRRVNDYKPLYYGSSMNKPLEFNLVFGVNLDMISKNIPMDRWDLEAIATWLTGPDGYRELTITQGDLSLVRYKCMITQLRQITVGWSPWAMACNVRCDSPYGYLPVQTFTYDVYPGDTGELYNRSSHIGHYLPKIKIRNLEDSTSGRTVSIKNHSDGNRELRLGIEIPSSVTTVTIDQQRGIIQSNCSRTNLYDHYNFNTCRLVRGNNKLEFSGRFTVDFVCEFPVNVGG